MCLQKFMMSTLMSCKNLKSVGLYKCVSEGDVTIYFGLKYYDATELRWPGYAN